MKIIKIVKKDEKTVAIHLDNEEVLFLSNEIFIKNGLRKSDEISEGLFNSLVRENQLFHLKQKAFRLLGRRHHASSELRLKLRQKGYDKFLVDAVIEELRSGNYINDYEFAVQYADENIKNKFWGKQKVESELIKRGVSREIISQVIDEKFPQGNKLESAVILTKKKIKSLAGRSFEDQKLRNKLISFLSSRGYDYETAKSAVDECIKEG